MIEAHNLVLPKQQVVKVKTTGRGQAEIKESVDTGTIIQDKINQIYRCFNLYLHRRDP